MSSPKARKIGDSIRAEISKVMRETLLLAEDNLKNSTPVDTGHASSNWILSLGSPFSGVAGSRDAVSYSQQRAGEQAVQSFDVGKHGKIYLTNNVLYMQFLDQGWSQQAEAGFVAACFLAATRRAPHGRKTAVRKMLKAMARSAYKRGI